jgi:c-di-GMP-binding flagellar brake protein YcgR
VWIESAPSDASLIEQLLEQKTAVGISFKSAPSKASFAVPILRREPSYQVNASSIVEALLLQTPTKIKPVQRRSHYRVRVPEGAPLSVRVWRIAEHVPMRDRPLASQLIDIDMRDLSIGGMGIAVHPDPAGQKLQPGQRLRVEVKWEEIELILEGVLRIVAGDAAAGAIRGGIQFKKLENDLAGRQAMAALTRIVGEFQREEVRRSRLGL